MAIAVNESLHNSMQCHFESIRVLNDVKLSLLWDVYGL